MTMLSQIEDMLKELETYRLEDYINLFLETPLHDLLLLADLITRKLCGKYVTFTVNLAVNYTNICTLRCPICAFSRSRDDPDAYLLSPESVAKIVEEAYRSYGILEVHLNGGLNPDLSPEYFEKMFRLIKQRAPKVKIKGLTCCEIAYYSRLWKMSIKETVCRLRDAGLDMLSGGCLEMYNEAVRKVITPGKISGEDWFNIARICYENQVPVNATMLFGHIEKPHHVVEHLLKVRDFQEKTGNIIAFIPLKFSPTNTQLHRSGIVKNECSTEYALRVIALSRIVLRDSVRIVSAYWVSLGKNVAQIAICSGANDLVGTMINEKVFMNTGKRETTTAEELAALIREAGKQPALRDSFGCIVRAM